MEKQFKGSIQFQEPRISEREERGSIHISKETSKVGQQSCKEAIVALFARVNPQFLIPLPLKDTVLYYISLHVLQRLSAKVKNVSEPSFLISPIICLNASNNFEKGCSAWRGGGTLSAVWTESKHKTE